MKLKMSKMRKELKQFAEFQEKILKKNDHKSHWSWCKTGWLLRRLGQELNELRRACKKGNTEEIKSECADVANFAMMIYDNLRQRGKHD